MNATCKRLLSWLVVVTMVLSMVPVVDLSGFAITTKAALSEQEQTAKTEAATVIADAKALKDTFKDQTGTVEAICPVCGGDVVQEWVPFTEDYIDNTPTGHYYLSADFSSDLTYSTTSAATKNVGIVRATGEVCFNLNGKNLTATGRKAISVVNAGAVLNIIDTAETAGTVTGYFNENTGAAISIQADATTSINVYGGTYKKLTPDSNTVANVKNSQQSSVVSAGSGTINWYAGTIDGTLSQGGYKNKGYAAGVQVTGNTATFNMYGGSIVNCQSGAAGGAVAVGIAASHTNATFNMLGGVVSGNNSGNCGGNFYVNGGILNVKDGTIENGVSTGSYNGTSFFLGGGNISLANGGTVNVSGGTITGGASKGIGGNIHVRNNTTGKINISGGKIIDGESTTASAEGLNIWVNSGAAGSELKISGGKISSGIFYGTNTTFELSGAPVIKKSGIEGQTIEAATGFAVTNGGNLDVSKITGGEIQIEGNLGDVFSARYEKAAEIAQYFVPVDATLDVVANDNNQLEIVEYQEPAVKAWCSACKEEKEWTELTGALHNVGGHYILKGDVDVAGYGIVLDNEAEAFTLCLDLKGHTLTANNVAIQVTTANTVNVMDTDDGGEVVGKQKGNVGAALTVDHADAVINLYGGTFLRGAAAATNEGSRAITIGANGGTVTAYEDVVIDGRFEGSTNYGAYPTGVYVQAGEFNLEGAEIIGGSSVADAGSVRVDTGAIFNLRSGSVHGGTARGGGNFYVSGGTLNIYGGTVYGGNATHTGVVGGGNILVQSSGRLHMEGGAIYGGAAKSIGGNIAVRDSNIGTVEIYGGKIYGGTAGTDAKGHNIYVGIAASFLTIGDTAEIAGDIVTGNGVTTTLSGTPKIKTSGLTDAAGAAVTGKTGLNVTASSNISVTGLKDGADIQVTGNQDTVFSKSGEDASAVAKYFTSTADKTKVKVNDAKQLMIAQDAPEVDVFEPWEHDGYAYCPVCEGEPVEWIDFNTIGHTAGTALAHGHYYLSAPITDTVATGTVAYIKNTTGTASCFNLNGQNLTVENGRVFGTNNQTVRLNLMDTVGTGIVTGNGANTGAVFHIGGGNAGSNISIYGGTYTSGSASTAIYFTGNGGTVTLKNGAVINGTEAVYLQGGRVTDMGTATTNYTGLATFNMEGGTINGTIAIGAVSSGSTNAKGQVVQNTNVATFNMTGGTINGDVSVRNDNTLTVANGTINGKVSDVNNSANADYDVGGKCTITLTGATTIAHLNVGADVTVNISGMTSGSVAVSGVIGEPLFTENANVTVTAFAADKYVAIEDGKVYLKQCPFAVVVTAEDKRFYKTAEEALAASEGGYIEIHADNQTITVADDQAIYVDNRGYTVNVNGEGTLYAMDAANDDYDSYGVFDVADGVTVENDVVNPINGKRYIVIVNDDGDTYSAHHVELYLTHASLRISQAGLYYKAQYKCDTKLAERVVYYGIQFTVNNTDRSQSEDFKDVMENNTVNGTSVAVFGIFKDGRTTAENVAAGVAKINATPYIDVAVDLNEYKEVTVTGDLNNDVYNANKAGVTHAAMSLYDVLKAINDNWNNYAPENQNGRDVQDEVRKFYNDWADHGMNAWAGDLANIANA